MRIIGVDDEKPALNVLGKALQEAMPEAEIHLFQKISDALEFMRVTLCNVAFLDIEMGEINGIELAKRMKEITPNLNLVFVTGHQTYMGNAFELHASGYLLKPVSKDAIRKEIENLRYPSPKEEARIRVQTFGNFDVFVEGEPIRFQRSKSKEILAYLIDRRGAAVTTKEIAAILWEDEPYTRRYQMQLQTCISAMMKSLRAVGAENMIRKSYNNLSVNKDIIACDYYDFLEMKPYAVNAYQNEYMTNYSWAEFSIGNL